MLSSITIQNVVLIDKLIIEFKNGFCALTGETGAGKSILLDSLGLALGKRADQSLVKKGADKAIVIASFDLASKHPVFALMDEHDIEPEDTLILRRVVNKDGGSKAFVNDQPISAGLLRQIGNLLVEIHGQFDTYGLLDAKTHLPILDEFGQIDDSKTRTAWKDWKTTETEYQSLLDTIEQSKADEDYLRQSLEDLDRLDPKGADEEETLNNLRTRLMNKDQVIEALNNAYHLLNEQSAVSEAFRTLERVSDKGGKELNAAIEALDRADSELQEALAQIQSCSDSFDDGEYNLEEIDDRLYALRGQARKHNCEVSDLPEIREQLAQKLNMIETEDSRLTDLARACEAQKSAYIKEAKTLGEQRRKAAETLDKKVAAELPPLKLEKARFVTQIEDKDEKHWNASGCNAVSFLIATNPGAEPGPLNKIASGGEMARFMLALKVVIAEIGAPQTMIFDEVDTGIGGATADAVGERLSTLSRDKQILVVTHAPQVAARANHHWIVVKESEKENAARTTVVPLSELGSRQEEIARMLAGAEITEEARAAAMKLMNTGT